MKICFISPYSSRGGAELSLIELIDALLPLGVECSCITRSQGSMSDLLAARGVEPLVVPFKPWVHPATSWHGRLAKILPHRQLFGVARLASAIKRSGCDLVYTNSIAAGAGAIAARLVGKPHIWHLREFGNDDYKLTYDLGITLSRFLMRCSSSAYIANSQSVADAYRKGLGGSKMSVVYNAVEMPAAIDAAAAADVWQRTGAIRCILLGKYLAGKGQEEAVKAMASLRDRGVPAELVLVGETLDNNYRRHIEDLIERYELTDRIQMLGHSGEPAPLVKSADVLLMCSRREAFGRVTVEGMKLGKPVVGTRSGGTPEIIDEGQTGFLYEPGNHDELASRIAYLHTHQGVRSEMGAKAFARAHRRFNRQTYGDDIARVIEQVSGKRIRMSVHSDGHGRSHLPSDSSAKNTSSAA